VSAPVNLPARHQCQTPIGIGIVGGGDISGRYVSCVTNSSRFKLVGVSKRKEDTEALVRDERVDLIVNLTPPLVHAGITRFALESGKHVYSEKPLAHELSIARVLCDLATERGLMLACAPATFLGPALQTALVHLQSGSLGKPIGARGIILYRGPDHWHHNPAPLFDKAAGPLFDMGVYHIAALIALLGPICEVTAMGSQANTTRSIKKGPRAGQSFNVKVWTHVAALLRFANGAIAELTTSFDGISSAGPALEVFGTRASLQLPHPSQFDGSVYVASEAGAWETVATAQPIWSENLWIVGLHATADRLEGEDCAWPDPALTVHALDAMLAIEASIETGSTRALSTTCPFVAPLSEAAVSKWSNSYLRAA